MKFIKNLPNILTLFNLFLGCLAVVYIFHDHMIVIAQEKDTFIDMGRIDIACYCVFLAAIIDFFDGFIARLLQAQSKLGAQLDSLADMVTFGLVPGVIMYELIARSYYANAESFDYSILYYTIGFALTIFAALRLAKFNIDERQATEFRGLPTPSMALFICALPLIILRDELYLADVFTNKWVLTGIVLVLCYLMVSDIRMLSFKMKSPKLTDNSWQYLLLGAASVIILWSVFILQVVFLIIPMLIVTYILISVIKNIKEYGI